MCLTYGLTLSTQGGPPPLTPANRLRPTRGNQANYHTR